MTGSEEGLIQSAIHSDMSGIQIQPVIYKICFSFSFVLYDNLYYLSAVEWAASAMEMSAISAKNAANMISHKWLPDQNANRQQTVPTNEEL